MSPEQVRGAEVDARSDLFAFGALLYEMLSGESAFRRETGVETLHAVLKEPAPRLRETRASARPAPVLQRVARPLPREGPRRPLPLRGGSRRRPARGAAAARRARTREAAVPRRRAARRRRAAGRAAPRADRRRRGAGARRCCASTSRAGATSRSSASAATASRRSRRSPSSSPTSSSSTSRCRSSTASRCWSCSGADVRRRLRHRLRRARDPRLRGERRRLPAEAGLAERVAAALERARTRDSRARRARCRSPSSRARPRRPVAGDAHRGPRRGARARHPGRPRSTTSRRRTTTWRCTREGSAHLKQQTLAELEASLDPARFVRIHRSYLLNVERLARIERAAASRKAVAPRRRHPPAASAARATRG